MPKEIFGRDYVTVSVDALDDTKEPSVDVRCGCPRPLFTYLRSDTK